VSMPLPRSGRWWIALVLAAVVLPPSVRAVPLPIVESYSYESNVAELRLGCPTYIAGDLNGDGFSDFAALAIGTQEVWVFYGSPTGPFTTPHGTLTGHGTAFWPAGDINGDGFDDLLITVGNSPTTPGHVYVFAGSALGLGSSPLTTVTVGPDSS